MVWIWIKISTCIDYVTTEYVATIIKTKRLVNVKNNLLHGIIWNVYFTIHKKTHKLVYDRLYHAQNLVIFADIKYKDSVF